MNRMERITKTFNLITGRSDHNMILAVRKLTKKRLVHHTKTDMKSVKSGITKCKTTDFKRELMQMIWDTVTETHDLNTCCDNFMTAINGLIDGYTKTWKSSPKRRSLPWFSQDIWQLMKKHDFALKRFLVTKTDTDHLIYTGLRNKIVTELCKAKTNYFSKLIEEAKGSSSKLWKHINCLTNSNTHKQQRIKELRINNKHISDNATIAN